MKLVKIKGWQKTSLIDFPENIASIIFLGGCCFRCGYCFTEKNLVFTNKGVLSIKKIFEDKSDNRIYGVNGKFNRISRFYKRKYTGKLAQIKTYLNTDMIECTSNHEFFVYSDKGIFKKRAEQLTTEDYLSIRIPKGYLNVTLNTKLALKNLYNELDMRKIIVKPGLFRKMSLLRKKDYSWRRICKILGVTNHVKRIYDRSYFKNQKLIPIIKNKDNKISLKGSNFYINKTFKVDKDFARLIGYYLAEGCVSKYKNRKNSYYLSFTFNEKEKRHIEKVKKVMKEKFKVILNEIGNEQNKTITLITKKNVVAMFFKYYFGKNVYTKNIPYSFLYLNKNIQKELIKGLFFGDGISSKKYITKYQKQRIQLTSKELLYQICLILYRLGIMNSRFRNELLIADKKIFDLLGQSKFISKKQISTKRYNKINSEYVFIKIKDIQYKKVKNEDVYNFEINDPSHAYNISLCCVSNCHNPDLVLFHDKLEDIDEDKLLLELEKKKGIIDGIVISGGEPTMYADLPKFIFKIREIGFLVKLDTNGSSPMMLKRLIENKLIDYVAMDVKAPFEKYPSVVGGKVNLEVIKESIKILKQGKVKYEFRTTMVPGLVEAEDVIKIGSELNGAKKFVIQNFRGGVNLVDNRYRHLKPFSKSELESVKEKIKDKFDLVEVR